MSVANAKYMSDEIARRLVNGKIASALLDTINGEFGFIVRMPDGTERKVWVSTDAEGNGPGWLHIEP